MRSILQDFGAAALAALLLFAPAAAGADPSLGPLLARDVSISTQGRAAAAVGFAPSLSAVGPLGYLVVWSETRDAVNGSDIYGRALTATGEYYGTPFVIASHPGNQENPILTWDGLRFVVFWHDQPSNALVARVVGLGGPSVGGEVVIATGAGKAAVASDGRAWNRTPSLGSVLVVWESSNDYPGSQGDIRGRFFNIGFNGVITPALSISGYHSMAHESAPSVAFGADRFLVTWNTEPVVNDDAHRDIWGFVMTADGQTAWGEFPITTAPSWQHNTGGNIAFNGTDFLIAWDDHRAGAVFEDVYAARVTPDGLLVDGPADTGGIPVSLDPGGGLPHAVRVVALEDEWLVVWAGTRARGARLASGGAVVDPVGADLSTAAGSQWFPGVASDGRSALVTWGSDLGGLMSQIVGPRPSAAEDLIAEVGGLVASRRLLTVEGARLAALLASGAIGGFLSRIENFLLPNACPPGWWNYETSCRITLNDGVALVLHGRWLLPTALVSNVDLGNEFDEWQHNLEGWGDVNNGLLPPEIDTDRTSRYQLLRGSNSVSMKVPEPGMPYVLAFRTEDGLCDDSFDVYVNGVGPIYSYRAMALPDTIFPLHKVLVQGSLLTEATARITFLNRATDGCGLAATYFVRLLRSQLKELPSR